MILAVTNVLFFINLYIVWTKTDNYLEVSLYTLIALGFMCIVFSILTIFDWLEV